MARKRKQESSLELELADAIRMSALDLQDPVAYLEERRLEYLKRIEKIADDAHNQGDRDLELKSLAYLVRLTSVYKTRVDVASTNLGLVRAPDLSRLGEAELKRLENASPDELETIAKSIRKEDLN
jgi:hypothetical protein